MLFLNSEKENVLYGLDLKCSNHAIQASTNLFSTYLPITLEFCELFSQLYLRAEPLVHPRGLQTFQKTLQGLMNSKNYILLTQTPTRRDRKTRKTERNTRPQYQKVSVSAREKMRALILRHACPLQSIDPRLFWCNISDFASSLLYISPQTAELGHQRLKVVVPRQDCRSQRLTGQLCSLQIRS